MLGASVFLYRRLGDRMRVMGRPLLLLTTIGARSGRRRETLVCRFPDEGEAWLVVASYAGAAQHPTWYINMAKHPDQVWVEIGKHKVEVKPDLLRGAARDEAWRRIVALAPGYGKYQEKTDREIPVIRLRPAQ
jgi:deazaflavin-dependent oxidoreductase (nitroreductase family)